MCVTAICCCRCCCHRGVAGEIRERQLHQLPAACMYMGRTSLTLDDIRQYNAAQGRRTYTLHENDCRYVVQAFRALQQLHWLLLCGLGCL
jgi:hypothetical protein